jgi:hypothetical protein
MNVLTDELEQGEWDYLPDPWGVGDLTEFENL